VVLSKEIDVVGEEVTGDFLATAGKARNRNIGVGGNREVASVVKGYVLEDVATDGGGRYISMSNLTLTLYPSWTYWANGDAEDEGNQDFDATTEMIKNYLIGKGYAEEAG
jgi:hypothetical protein